jgi:hypothetical protein
MISLPCRLLLLFCPLVLVTNVIFLADVGSATNKRTNPQHNCFYSLETTLIYIGLPGCPPSLQRAYLRMWARVGVTDSVHGS